MATHSTKGLNALALLEKQAEALRKATEATESALEEGSQAMQWIVDLALDYGMSAKNPTVYNAKAYIESDLEKKTTALEETEQIVKEAGYTSVPDLLRRHKRQLTGTRAALEAFRGTVDDWAQDFPTVRYNTKNKQSNLDGKLDRLLLRYLPLVEEFVATFSDDAIDDLRKDHMLCNTLEDVDSLIRRVGAELRVTEEIEEEREEAGNELVSIKDHLEALINGSTRFNLQIREAALQYAVEKDIQITLREHNSYDDCREKLLAKTLGEMMGGLPCQHFWNFVRNYGIEGKVEFSLDDSVTAEAMGAVIKAINAGKERVECDWALFELAKGEYERVVAGGSTEELEVTDEELLDCLNQF